MVAFVIILSFCVLLSFLLAGFLNWISKYTRKECKLIEREYVEPFSTTEYFDRIEKEYNEILKQKERKFESEEYVIILWWGLDGLRLNKDGSSEWISKRKKEPTRKEQAPVSSGNIKYRGAVRTLFELCSVQADIGDIIYVHETALMYVFAGDGNWNPVYHSSVYNTDYQSQQCCCTMDYINSLQAQCTQSTQSRILELQERNQQLQFNSYSLSKTGVLWRVYNA